VGVFRTTAFCCFFGLLLLTPSSWLWLLQPFCVLAVVFFQVNLGPRPPMQPGMILLHLACFYLSARLCLGMLAADRPAAPALTTYYTWIGLGGLSGGLFQLLLAPLLFRRDYLEYSMLAALATTLCPARFPNGISDWLLCFLVLPKKAPAEQTPYPARRRIAIGFDLGFALLAAAVAAGVLWLLRDKAWDRTRLDLALGAVLFGVAVLHLRPVRFGLALAAVVCLSFIGMDAAQKDKLIVQQRTSFGILRVTENIEPIRVKGGDFGEPMPAQFTQRRLMHSTTHHGLCITDPPEMLRYPTTYYHRKGPVGRVMRTMEWFRESAEDLRQLKGDFWLQRNRDNAKDDARIVASLLGMGAGNGGAMDLLAASWSEPPYACIGLGTGTLLTYAHPFQRVDAFELDPAIVELSTQTPPVFHYFQSAQQRGVNASIIPGDARRSLAKPDREGFYHVIFVDAFNSNAVPMHLLTQEAIELYFQKLAPGGVVCFHTSNRHVELSGVLENNARQLHLASRVLKAAPNLDDDDPALFASEWVLLARNHRVLLNRVSEDAFDGDERKNLDRPAARISTNVVWTDEHASLLSAVRPGAGWPGIVYGLLVTVLVFGVFLGLIEIAFAMMPRRITAKPAA
jgi:SAM-dependent methyltransferase